MDRDNVYTTITPLDEARRFMVDCFKAVGTPQEQAEIISENLLEADYRGHYSHGMNRLELYIQDILSGRVDPKATGHVEKESAATALINGSNGLGAVVGKYCMDLAIKKAKDVGIGLVVAYGSNHYGIAGIYTLQAIKEGCIGLSFTNTSPCMVPTRAKDAPLGSNPLSFGAPGLNGDNFVLDMATTCVALGKVEIQLRKGEPIPEGWALNSEGKVEIDAERAIQSSRLMPLGGHEIHSGYKGYGLGMMVEILCGILSGSAFGPNIPRWGFDDKISNLGQAFIAINPNNFAPNFEGRLTDLMDYLRNMPTIDPDKPVLVHGDPEKMHMQKVREIGGLCYLENQIRAREKLARKLEVKPMIFKSTK